MGTKSDAETNFLLKLAVLDGKWKLKLLTFVRDGCSASVTRTPFFAIFAPVRKE